MKMKKASTRIKPLLFLIVISLFASPLLAQNGDEGMTLRGLVVPKPKILGVSFDDNKTTVQESLKKIGMLPKHSQDDPKHPHRQALLYNSVPEGLWITEGESQFLFFNDELIRINLSFPATYSNFLILKKQLFHSLGERFTVAETKESMDDFLKAHLANLKNNEYSERTEEEIINALKRGNTFFFYALADNKNEMDVSLVFSAYGTSKENLKPQLLLQYISTEGFERLIEYENNLKTKILPE